MDLARTPEETAVDFMEMFVRSMMDRDYNEARALLGEETAADWTTEKLAVAWVSMLVDDSSIVLFSDSAALDSMEGSPERHTSDIAWIYMALTNEAVNEGVSGIVFETPHGYRIRDLEFGRQG